MNGPIAFVTGGTGSVGEAIVRALVNEGYTVLFQYHRNVEAAERLAKELGCSPVQMEFGSPHVSGWPDQRVTVLINCAGVNVSPARSAEMTDEEWDYTLNVNLTAAFAAVRAYLPGMISEGGGRIININSIYGFRAVPGNLAYTVSKHGMTGLTRTVALEYAELGVRCNEVCPGAIESQMMRTIADRNLPSDPESYLAAVADGAPTKRMTTPEEVAGACMYLLSGTASNVNGVSLVLDGGETVG